MTTDIIWMRDLDGTGSMHPCAEGDRGAVAYVAVEAKLPCDVTVHPATTFRKGTRLTTLLGCIEDRRHQSTNS